MTQQPWLQEQDIQEKTSDHSLNVTTTSKVAVVANKGRTALFIVNDSDTVIRIGLRGEVTATTGIRLNAAGGALVIDKQSLYRGEISVIHAGVGNKWLSITELESRYGRNS